jgi:hypothetical protein
MTFDIIIVLVVPQIKNYFELLLPHNLYNISIDMFYKILLKDLRVGQCLMYVRNIL